MGKELKCITVTLVEIHNGSIQNFKGAATAAGLTSYKCRQPDLFQPAFSDGNYSVLTKNNLIGEICLQLLLTF